MASAPCNRAPAIHMLSFRVISDVQRESASLSGATTKDCAIASSSWQAAGVLAACRLNVVGAFAAA